MVRMYTPEPYPYPLNEREELVNRLWKCGAMVPDHKTLDISHLRDIVEWQEYQQTQPRPRRIVTIDRALAAEISEWRRKKGLDRRGQPV